MSILCNQFITIKDYSLKFFYFFIFSLLVPNFLVADAIYLLVAKTNNKDNLPYIKSKLHNLQLNALVYKSDGIYTVYSGPLKDEKEASYALKRAKRSFAHADIVSFDTQTKNATKKGYFFVNGSLASLTLPYEHTIQIGNIPLNTIDSKATGYIFEGGYNFENNIFVTMSFMNAASSTNTLTNLYSSLNYKINIKRLEPYVGILGGISSLAWDKSPMLEANSSPSTSLVYGLQAGLNYDTGFHNIALLANYRYTVMNHSIPLKIIDGTSITASSTLNHNLVHGLNLGVQYRF